MKSTTKLRAAEAIPMYGAPMLKGARKKNRMTPPRLNV
jgi:hypothetical protein